MRIVSLLPSATEIVCLLGLGNQLVGVTHECDFPAEVSTLPKMTRSLISHAAASCEINHAVAGQQETGSSLYQLDEELLNRLRPDLIITQGLCDVCAVSRDDVRNTISRLDRQPDIISLEPTTLEEVLGSIVAVGDAADVTRQAHEAVEGLRGRIEKVSEISRRIEHRPRVVFLEWIDPPFSAGHWDSELVGLAGGIECIGKVGEASRRLEWNEVISAQPDVLFIACCGFSIERTLQDMPILGRYPLFAELPAARTDRVFICDGSHYFSRPGPRLIDSLEILANALHPEVHALPEGLERAVYRYEAAESGKAH